MAYTDIDDPSAYFQCTLHTGTGSEQAITHGGNSDLQADLVWIKRRDATNNHRLTDVVRGVTEELYTDIADAEDTQAQGLKSFASDGFTLGTNAGYNANNGTYVSWNWKKQAGIFDIVSYTGNGSNRTISHSLGSVPKMMIVKRRNASASWFVYHVSNGNGNVMKLDLEEAASAYAEYWNETTPTSSVFSLGTATTANADGGTFIAYLFGNKQGVSNMGTYLGNGNVDGTFIYTGFKPAFFLAKKSSQAGNYWSMWDNKRSTSFNPIDLRLAPNVNGADITGADCCDFLSNGVKLRATDTDYNGSGLTYIYMAFAENPLVTSTGVPATAR